MSAASDIQELETRLVKAKSTISVTIRALSSIPLDPVIDSSASFPPDLPLVLSNLLKSFRHSTTSLALSFKPPLTIPAALQQLDKFTNELCQASSCVLVAASQGRAGVMLDEWRDGVMDICTEAVRFLDVLLESAQSGASGSGNEENPYLHHTGLVWDSIDSLANTLSATEAEAVIKRWKMDTAVVKDAWSEFKESIEGMEVASDRGDEEGGKQGGMEGDDEDEDDLMDFGSDTITRTEMETVESIKPLLQLLQILHSFLPRYMPSLDLTNGRGRAIVKSSNSFITAFDDLVCALYPEHSSAVIDDALREVDCAVRETSELLRAGGIGKDGLDFLEKWEGKMKGEKQKWDERRLGLGGLADSLG